MRKKVIAGYRCDGKCNVCNYWYEGCDPQMIYKLYIEERNRLRNEAIKKGGRMYG